MTRERLLEFGQRHGVAARALALRLDRLVARARPFIARLDALELGQKRTRQLADAMTTRLDALSNG